MARERVARDRVRLLALRFDPGEAGRLQLLESAREVGLAQDLATSFITSGRLRLVVSRRT